MLEAHPPPAPFESARPIELKRLYLLNTFHGSGLGKRMLVDAMNLARELEFDSIWLTVWEINKRAIRLYTDTGFEVFGTQDFIVGTDIQKDLLMGRKL